MFRLIVALVALVQMMSSCQETDRKALKIFEFGKYKDVKVLATLELVVDKTTNYSSIILKDQSFPVSAKVKMRGQWQDILAFRTSDGPGELLMVTKEIGIPVELIVRLPADFAEESILLLFKADIGNTAGLQLQSIRGDQLESLSTAEPGVAASSNPAVVMSIASTLAVAFVRDGNSNIQVTASSISSFRSLVDTLRDYQKTLQDGVKRDLVLDGSVYIKELFVRMASGIQNDQTLGTKIAGKIETITNDNAAATASVKEVTANTISTIASTSDTANNVFPDQTGPVSGGALTFSNVTETSMTVSWPAATDGVTAKESLQYKLVRATTSAAIDTIAEVDAISGADLAMEWSVNTLTKNVTALAGETTYHFAVLVKDSAGNKTLYSGGEQATSTPVAAPSAFSMTSAAASDGQVVITWPQVTGATSYQVKRGTSSGSYPTTLSSGATSPYTDSTATNGTTYYYMVTAENSAGSTNASAEKSATPVAAATAPSAFSMTSAVSGNGQVVITWPVVTGAASYILKRGTSSGSYTTTLSSSATSPYTDSTVVNGTTYYYMVTAVNTIGSTNASAQLSALPSVPVVSVAKIAATSLSSTSIGLSWTAATNALGGNLTYKVYRSAVNPSNASFVSIANVESGTLVTTLTNTTTATVSGLTLGNAYYFNVVVLDANGAKAVYSALGEFFSSSILLAYPFNNNANDIVGSNNATVQNAPVKITDRFGYSASAYLLDRASSQYLISSSNLGISGKTNVTLSIWVKGTNVATQGLGGFIMYGANVSGGAGAKGGMGLAAGADGNADKSYLWANSGAVEQDLPIGVSTSNWQHWVLVYNTTGGSGSGGMYAYVNGVAYQPITNYTNINLVNSPLVLGAWTDINTYFGGSIDDVHVYTGALTVTEVNRLYDVTR